VVVGEANDGAEAGALTRRLDPDVVLMDVQMPVMNGIEATRQIVALGREESSRVVILTTFDLDEYVYEALKAGASGFLLKRTPAEDLVTGVRVVAQGEALLAPSVTQRLIENFRQRPDAAPARDVSELDDLTEREREVLVLVARGMTNGDIAAHLFLSEGTVKTHVKRIFAKLGLHDRTQAVILAYEVGLVRAGEDPAEERPPSGPHTPAGVRGPTHESHPGSRTIPAPG
jgi:DNA-binding NarL/FixJ family response regulator